MNISKSIFLLGLSITLAGCSTSSGGGSIAPLAFSSSGSSTYLKALHGGIVSRVNGVQLDRTDSRLALEAEYRALEAAPGGQAVEWQGGDGVAGKVVAAAPYQVGSQNCRQYTHTLTLGMRSEVARGAACRNGDGTWTPLT
ncbi:hypothetical protein [Rhizobium sp. L1K21]|uniref:hypothetical protein n=1 Tax=Rhizobium sp. L1K21 TaxID=2954933 RepID=UPI002093ADC4|nr:hypothetical protein [Rhizobium sp. L1K21]MCO6186676.1 hypothetical protein [Rhizobium sp. L1K21]